MENRSTTAATDIPTPKAKPTKQASTKGEQNAEQYDLRELAQTIGALSTYLIIGGDIGGKGLDIQYPEAKHPFTIEWRPDDFAYLLFVLPRPDDLPHGCYVIEADETLQGGQ